MNFLEKIKLLHRAYKYRYVDDRAEIKCMLQHISKGDTVFDIGAHKGGYTFWMRQAVGKTGKVVAFEPQMEGAVLLKELFPDITVERLAVSSVSDTKTLYVQQQSYSVSFEASLNDNYKDGVSELVSTTTIDEYCAMHSLQPSFIKIDVEGHEPDVLKGAVNTLRFSRPYLLIEAEKRHVGEDGMQDLFEFLKGFDYSGSFYFNERILSVEKFRAAVHQRLDNISDRKLYSNNFVFAPGPGAKA